jgi:hypothetical protein
MQAFTLQSRRAHRVRGSLLKPCCNSEWPRPVARATESALPVRGVARVPVR